MEWKQKLLLIQLSHTYIYMDTSTHKHKNWVVYIKGKSEWRISPYINMSFKSCICIWIYLLFSWINSTFPDLHCLPSTCIKDFCFYFRSFLWLIVIFYSDSAFSQNICDPECCDLHRNFRTVLIFRKTSGYSLLCFVLFYLAVDKWEIIFLL